MGPDFLGTEANAAATVGNLGTGAEANSLCLWALGRSQGERTGLHTVAAGLCQGSQDMEGWGRLLSGFCLQGEHWPLNVDPSDEGRLALRPGLPSLSPLGERWFVLLVPFFTPTGWSQLRPPRNNQL